MTSTTKTFPPDVDQRGPGPVSTGVPLTAAWLLALGSFLSLTGFAWDLQWHGEVGPDTFFTVPHLFIYAGSAVVGLVCLVASLRILITERAAGDRLSLHRIPRPYLVAGFGTVVFLLCGLWDEWWHSVYGFDVTILSPPHIGLLTCIQVGMVGAILAFASVQGGAVPSAEKQLSRVRSVFGPRSMGVAFVTACSVSFLVFFSGVASFVPTAAVGIDPGTVYLGVIFTVALVFAASATRLAFSATLVAVFVLLLKGAAGWFTLAANDWYANLLGLFLRDEVITYGRSSSFADALPLWSVLAAGLAVDAILELGRRRRLPGGLVVAVAGGTAGLAMSAFAFGMDATRIGLPAASVATVLTLVCAGTLAGLIAWQLGNLARAVR